MTNLHSCGSPIVPGNRFCTGCGELITEAHLGVAVAEEAAPSGLAPPPIVAVQTAASGRDQWSGPHGAGSTDLTLDDNSAAPASDQRRGRRPLAIVGGVVVLAVLIGGAFVLFSGADDTALTGGQAYRGPNADLLLLNSFSPEGGVDEVSFAVQGSDEPPTDLVDASFEPARLLGPQRVSLAAVGGPMVGEVTRDGEVRIVRFDRSTGDETELLDGGIDYDVLFDAATNVLLVIEYRESSANRCYVGELMGELRRVGRGDGCSFSASGRYIVTETYDEDSTAYEIVDRNENIVATGESAAGVEFMANERFLMSYDGSFERRSVVITDLETGEIVVESTRGEGTTVLDSNQGGFALVASHDGDGTALLEVLSTNGEVREIVSNEGPISASLLTASTDEALVSLTTLDGTSVATTTRPDDGAEAALEEIIDDDEWVQTLVLPSAFGDDVFVVASRNGDDGVLNVNARSGMVELDVNDLEYVDMAVVSADGSRLLVEVAKRVEGDGSVRTSLVAVNLADGTHTWLIEDWESLRIEDVSSDAGSILIVGREDVDDADVAVVHLSLDGTLELADEAQQINTAAYTPDGAGILFSTSNDGEYEVLEYRLGERTRPKLLHSDVALYIAGWHGFDIPRQLVGSGYFEAPLPGGLCSTEFPELPQLMVGSSLDGSVPEYGSYQLCLQIDAASDVVVSVSSEFDPIMDISGPYGSPDALFQSYFGDDENGSNPLIGEFFEPGAYQVVITGYDSSSGSFAVQAS